MSKEFDRAALRRQPVDWAPAIDIAEFADRYELTADLPGVAPDSIDIEMHENVLTISGERGSVEAARSRHRERATGRFSRRFTLPGAIDAESIEARSRHGVLTVRLLKQARARARRISIEAA